MVNLLRGAAAMGIPLDLILGQAEGPLLQQVPPQVRVLDLKLTRLRNAIRPLARYLRQERPHGLLSRMSHTNLTAILARRLAGVDTRVVVAEASNFSANLARGEIKWWMPPLLSWAYRCADVVVAVSVGVARDMERALSLRIGRVRVIYNPVVDSSLLAAAQAPSTHPWLELANLPVFLSVGRLNIAKDQATLLRAFALVRQQLPARLVILGEGELRGRLQRCAVNWVWSKMLTCLDIARIPMRQCDGQAALYCRVATRVCPML